MSARTAKNARDAKTTQRKAAAKPVVVEHEEEVASVEVVAEKEPEPTPVPVERKSSKTRAKVVEEPVEPEEVEEVEEVEEPEEPEPVATVKPEQLRKRMTVPKGHVKVSNAKKSTNKRGTTRKERSTSAPAKRAARSVGRRANSKSSTRSPKGGKGKGRGKKAKNAPRERRPFNVEPAPIDKSGIGIGPAKVKKVLMHVAFNPVEFNVRKELIKAENKPVRPKPTKDNPDPEMPEQGPTVPVAKLPKSILEVVEQAEKVHRESLQSEFEHEQIKAMDDETRSAYKKAKKAAYTEAKRVAADPENFRFDLRAFNVSFNKKFYANFKAWCNENDSYLPGKTITDKNKNVKVRFNEWTRAMARNGMINCVASKNSNLQLQHALTLSDDFDERVPLDAFARTFDGYQNALNWIEGCRQTKEERDELKARIKKGEVDGKVEATLPAYPDPEYDENFGGYVVDICRSVRIQLANSQKSAADKAAFHNIKISENFKKFCSIIINEAILRIGAHLKEVIMLKDVKTVNENIMYHTLRQVSNICGNSFAPIEADLKTRLAKFETWCAKRREERKANKNKEADDDANAELNEDLEAVTMQAEDDTGVHDTEDNENDEDVVSGNGDEDEDEELEEEEEVAVAYEEEK